jgi:hypothetical protein
MSQFDFATIDPNAKSGTQLAVDLNNWRDALHSCHRGAERPAYAQGGMLWVRETSSEQWDLMFYDGDTDFVLRSVNPTTNQLIGIPQDGVAGLPAAIVAIGEAQASADAAQAAADAAQDSADSKQPADTTLTALSGVTAAANKLIYATGPDAFATTDLTAFARTLLDDADEEAARGTLSVYSKLEIDSKVSITESFDSGDVSYSNGGALTFAHGLGVQPKFILYELTSVTGQGGYAAGDVLYMPPGLASSGGSTGLITRADSTNIYLNVGAGGLITLALPSGSGGMILTPANWKLRVRAFA